MWLKAKASDIAIGDKDKDIIMKDQVKAKDTRTVKKAIVVFTLAPCNKTRSTTQ